MERPLWVRWLKVYAVGGVIIGTGLLLFKYTTPSDQQLIDSLSPQLRLQYEQEKKLRQAEQQELMKVVQKTAASNDPIWKTGPIQSPWETKTSSLSIDDKFQKANAEEAQRNELARIKKELNDLQVQSQMKTKEIVDEKTKNWWKFW
ncbi:Cbp4p NDAI_0D02000 [Naumovozyma dairenensis CBS 421]|uniref:Cytochrome b mRNA-processing protein 4 n=1 Tax=Naumovozyma dairenensis (strain ATCC 10597 / BCRC 20456 / CBS 421 / NBRC 0211 / NRRL Y-12639) TaxID=1071378 RepID=G0W9Q3_NAUDC|nr:hypothetical protein NDAI_0D02000 [Naumovozyma dairenensis CBS 421]CCD24514.1 hypothetical protein NDAI_0D02000 [Naumovozyma dairenensis CBS 421]